MKRQLAALIWVAASLSSTLGWADSREACEQYRQEVIQLKADLDRSYGENRIMLRDMNADPVERKALLARYVSDPKNIRFRELMDKFRADRRDQCGWWTPADGTFN